MKKIKISLAMFAVLLGTGLAFSTSAHSFKKATLTYEYGRLEDGTWVPIDDANFECNPSENTCKANFTYENPAQGATPDAGVVESDGTYAHK